MPRRDETSAYLSRPKINLGLRSLLKVLIETEMPVPLSVHFDFLKTEVELGLTLVRLADIEAHDTPLHSALALAKASKAVHTIREFLTVYTGFTSEQLAYLEERCSIIEASLRQVPLGSDEKVNEALRGP